VLENIERRHPEVQETDRRALLGIVRHRRPRPPTSCHSTLSGRRAGQARVWRCWPPGETNVLLLDEPTNNLDPSSIEAVGTMLSQWPGTIVVVSHDRAFVKALQPTHSLKLPDEIFTHWDDAELDLVEMK
jgi:ATPase subunit of ABC transporter with duplicated ATPase domains